MNGLHGIIFCYEKRPGLRELVEPRSAASVPFGGRYRAIDFGLSNLVNAGATDVGVVLHGRYQSLLDHLGSGKSWDLSRKRGGLKLLPPFLAKGESGVQKIRGKMEALSGIRSYLDTIRQDHVALMDGDLVANLPLAEILETHIRTEADITAVCGNDSFAVDDGTYFETSMDGRVREVLYHMHRPRGYRGLDVYVISTQRLKELVDECTSHDQSSWRRDILQSRVDRMNIRAFMWGGYAAQMRTVQEYYDRSMQILDAQIRRDLFTPERPVLAKSADRSSSYVGPGGRCLHSLLGDGCNVEGIVENSILFPGVVVEAGAQVRNCVLFRDTVVRKNANLAHVIADKQTQVLPDRTLMGHASYPLVLSKGACV